MTPPNPSPMSHEREDSVLLVDDGVVVVTLGGLHPPCARGVVEGPLMRRATGLAPEDHAEEVLLRAAKGNQVASCSGGGAAEACRAAALVDGLGQAGVHLGLVQDVVPVERGVLGNDVRHAWSALNVA